MKKIVLILIIMQGAYFSQAQGTIRIAGLQMDVSYNITENEQRISKYLYELKDKGIDFLVTPEGSLSGYTSRFDGAELLESLKRIESLASELGIGMILGTCYKETIKGREYCYNQARVYLPDGTFLGAYSKILTCSPLDNPGTGEMMEYVSGSVKTFSFKGVDFGILICNDLWATPGYTTIPNPYLPWKMQEAGARLIFHIINSGTDLTYRDFHEASVALWARTLKMPVIEINAAHGEQAINARSGMVDINGERVEIVNDQGEQLFIQDIKID